ncbi:Phage shock protein B [compost metagenome]
MLHYRAKGRIGAGLADNEREQLQGLLVRAEKMQERVGALESILDAEVPGWRNKV